MARPATAMYQLRMFARRNPFKVVTVAAMIALIAVFGVMQWLSAARERTLRHEATANAQAAGRNAIRALLTAADAIMDRHPTKALAHLEAVPSDQRGWEWRYLWAKLHWNAAILQSDSCPVRFPGNGSIALDHAGRRVLAAGLGEVRLWDLNDANPRVLRDHTSFVYNTAFSQDGRWLASGAWDGTVRIWDAARGTARDCLEIYPDPSQRTFAYSVAFAPQGSMVRITPRWSLSTRVYDVDADEWVESAAPLSSVAASNPALRAAAHVLGESRGDSKCVAGRGGENVATSWDRSRLAEGTDSGEVIVKELATGRELRRFHAAAHAVLAVAFSPDGNRIVSGDLAGLIRVWDVATGAPLGELRGHASEVYTLNFCPDGTRLASGGNDNVIILWDAQRYEQVFELIGHSGYVHSVCFSPDGSQLVSGSGDTTVCIWDTLSPVERRSAGLR